MSLNQLRIQCRLTCLEVLQRGRNSRESVLARQPRLPQRRAYRPAIGTWSHRYDESTVIGVEPDAGVTCPERRFQLRDYVSALMLGFKVPFGHRSGDPGRLSVSLYFCWEHFSGSVLGRKQQKTCNPDQKTEQEALPGTERKLTNKSTRSYHELTVPFTLSGPPH